VVVRLLIRDDPQQTPIAARASPKAIAAGCVDIPDVVRAELAWVLRGSELDRPGRFQLPEQLVRTRGVVVDDIDAVIDALEHVRQGGDLADHLILARASGRERCRCCASTSVSAPERVGWCCPWLTAAAEAAPVDGGDAWPASQV
jgi:predicted nucleic-acid-binding protein